ncbi:MAG: phosphate signaling complex protein PhoU [Rhodospirillales bacterium]|nr:phosphate signaling complex protein PhoU [Rhodospirillales bacterium]
MPPTGPRHIVSKYDQELANLHDLLARMGELAQGQMAATIDALLAGDAGAASRVMAEDSAVNACEHEVNEQSVRLLALRSPVADDLRAVVTGLKVASAIERVADHAANVASRTLALNQHTPKAALRGIVHLGRLVADLFAQALDAYLARAPDRAMEVWRRDQEVDDLHSSLFRELLTYMMEDPRTITACSHLVFIAKDLERVGDQATNIAEMTSYLVTARPITDDRPKRDVSSSIGAGSDEDV